MSDKKELTIEEKAELATHVFSCDSRGSRIIKRVAKRHYIRGYNDALNTFRWRKVEEEMPPKKEKDYFILCKTDNSQNYSVALVSNEIKTNWKRYFSVFNVTHWMPIPKVDKEK